MQTAVIMSSKISCLAFIFLSLINLNNGNSTHSAYNCLNNGNYTSNSAYRANLNTLLSTFSSKIDSNGFYNASAGENPDRVSALALCRGDVGLDTCRGCVANATAELPQVCPYYKQAILWRPNDQCMLRYSNDSIFGRVETEPYFSGYRVQDAVRQEEFNQDLRMLLDSLRSQASNGGPLKKYAAANMSGRDFLTIYGLVQCTPDLTSDDCSNCFTEAYDFLGQCCSGKTGFGVLYPSCYLRYETYLFYNRSAATQLARPPPPPPPLPPPPSIPQLPAPAPPGKKDNNTTPIVLIIIIPIVVICLVLAVCTAIIFTRRRKGERDKTIKGDNEISTVDSLQYDFATIRAATDNFSLANKLGQGGFGVVYKGKLISGQEIAVKRLSANSGQGDLEFKNEVLLLARLQHRNLVQLLGFSLHGKERLLVYEYVENGSLDRFLFDPKRSSHLDPRRRYKIIGGVARGLLYLHEESQLTIIHRDLKAGNVLLDGNMNPKISDFGMAKLFVQDETQGNTSRIVGTYGYMAPEYAIRGQFSSKSDVFSFGVLILEIITGQKISSFQNGENEEDLLSCAWKNWHDGTIPNIIDPTILRTSRSLRDIQRCVHIGLLCVQEDAAIRPTMASVVFMLTSFSMTLQIPSRPAFFLSSTFEPNIPLQGHSAGTSNTRNSSNIRSDNSTHFSINEVSMSELDPR